MGKVPRASGTATSEAQSRAQQKRKGHRKRRQDPALEAAIERAGGLRPLARKLGITAQAVHKWIHCPLDRLVDVEKATGVPREQLRPDIFKK